MKFWSKLNCVESIGKNHGEKRGNQRIYMGGILAWFPTTTQRAVINAQDFVSEFQRP